MCTLCDPLNVLSTNRGEMWRIRRLPSKFQGTHLRPESKHQLNTSVENGKVKALYFCEAPKRGYGDVIWKAICTGTTCSSADSLPDLNRSTSSEGEIGQRLESM